MCPSRLTSHLLWWRERIEVCSTGKTTFNKPAFVTGSWAEAYLGSSLSGGKMFLGSGFKQWDTYTRKDSAMGAQVLQRNTKPEYVVHYFERADPKIKPFDADKENIKFRKDLSEFRMKWHGYTEMHNPHPETIWEHLEEAEYKNPTGWEDDVYEPYIPDPNGRPVRSGK